jgi:uncharacterized membrane protein
MTVGPVHLLVLGFNRPDFHGEVITELERLRETDTVRVIDSLVVYKDAEGGPDVGLTDIGSSGGSTGCAPTGASPTANDPHDTAITTATRA